jgi:hypothetical protein
VVKLILRLGHADREVPVARRLPGPELVADGLVRDHLVGVVDALGDRLDLLEERHLVRIERREGRGPLRKLDDLARQVLDPRRALRPVPAQDRLGALRRDVSFTAAISASVSE